MPHDLPRWKTVYHYFRLWQKEGRWQRWHQNLRNMLRRGYGRKALASAAVLDSQSSKTVEGGEARGFDAGKVCWGRKRHILVDTLGLLLGVAVTAANVQDRDGARIVLAHFYQSCLESFCLRKIWADGGYQGKLVDWVEDSFDWRLEVVKRNRQASGFEVLPKRWIVERNFAWLMRNRRLCRDYERSTQTSEAFIYIAMIRLMTKRLAKL